MSAANSTGLPEVEHILQRARRQILLHNGIAGLATLLTTGVAYLLLATASDLLLGLPGGVRAVTLLVFVSIIGFVVWKSLVRPLKTRLPVDQLGAAVDLSCPEMQEGLSTLISVQRADASSSEAGSELMRQQLQQQVHSRLTHVGDASFVDTQRLKKQCGLAGLAIVVALTPLLLWPSGSQLLLQRFAQPFANLSTVSNLYFDVENGSRVVARGSDAVIRATPKWRSESPGRRPDEVWLEMVSQAGASDRLAMSFDEVSGQFTVTLSQIEESVDYSLSGGGVDSQSFRLTVVDAPQLTSAVLNVTPPPYAGRPVETFEGMVEAMSVFERSEMQIQLQFNKPITTATLVWTRRDERPLDDIQLFDREFDHITGEEVLELDPDAPLGPELPELVMRSPVTIAEDGLSGQLDLAADVGGDFHFELTDDVELTNADYLDRTLTVIYDQPPLLQVTGAENLERYRQDDIVPVNARATDDIGIGELELHYYVNDQAAMILPATTLEPGSPEVAESFRLRMSDLHVEDGDVVRIRVRCADERPEPGPHEVWSEEVNIEIDKNAPPPAARAMEQETKKIIEGLRELERQLEKDQLRATELEQDARDGWSDDGQEQAQRLSEKQQQQGRVMELIASQVATHPLMEEAAGQLRELSPRLSQDIPNRLETAAAQQRNLAAESLRRAETEIGDVRQQLGDIISDIEQRAELEKDLAELNRLALEAEDIANRADELKSDRDSDANKPDETSEQDWEQQLDERARQISEDQTDLTGDIEDLLDREQELLKAAQQAQMSRLKKIQQAAGEIASRQQRVADAADSTADQVGREQFRAIEQLSDLQRQAEQLETAENDPQQPKASEQIDAAARQLEQGNLDSPRQTLNDAQQTLESTRQRAADAAKQATGDQQQQLEQRARQAAELSRQLNDAKQQMEQSEQQRTFDEQAAQQPDSPQQQAAENAERLLDRLDQLTDMAESQSQQVSEKRASEAAEQSSQRTSEQANSARESAAASQFPEAARQLRQASTSAAETAGELRAGDDPQAADLSTEVEKLKRELTRTADMLDGVTPQSQAATRQSAQNNVAKQTAELPAQLSELSERMQLEALQMPQQAQAQASAAAQQAEQASQQASQAAAQMQNAEFRQAAESGQQAADQLQQIAGTPGESSQSSSESSMVPEDVGESVADALQNLKQAAEAMQQEGGQPQQGEGGDQNAEQGGQGTQPGQSGEGQASDDGQPQPGEGDQTGGQSGQSGQGQPSADALNSAAKSLAQAASNALPGQFNPNQSQEQQQAGADGMGNPASWDGLLPDRGGSDVEGSRDWGRIVDEIDSETLDNARITRDSTYESLIRMYFRELAKAAEK
ncbi:MAG: hypothetical protein NXI04_25135 [Planctomycetaceae bacterium]|nr:hypothetical protein [Planctomycetaceae bacterium]